MTTQPQTQTLANDRLIVEARPAGAELVSVRSAADGTEFLWQADPAHWARHAPHLFPVVGRLRDDRYSFGGNTFELPQHGFARDSLFTLVEQSHDSLCYQLCESDETLARYPFRFVLSVGYRLEAARLTTTYEVTNPATDPMYFSIGGHPAFRCPLLPGEAFSDYRLVFEHPETAARWHLADGLIGPPAEAPLAGKNVLPLTGDLFARGALVFKGLQSSSVTLRNDRNDHRISIEFAGFPYFGIWTKPGPAPFVCLEPWHSIADAVDASGELVGKEGIRRLEPQESFRCAYTIAFT